MFFIVLDLRLTKVGVQRYSFFYVHTFGISSYVYSPREYRGSRNLVGISIYLCQPKKKKLSVCHS
ncbi:hypothetical protein F2Y70_10920, partial [Bacteroides cellulosilyticus]